jgi:hypothetical protein
MMERVNSAMIIRRTFVNVIMYPSTTIKIDIYYIHLLSSRKLLVNWKINI